MKKSKVYFEEVARRYLAEETKYGNPKPYDAHRRIGQMIEVWGDRTIDRIDDHAVAKFFAWVRNLDVSNDTKNTYVTYYRAVMHYAMNDMRVIQYVPQQKSWRGKEHTTFLEPRQLENLFASLDPLRADIARFAVYTGLRKGNASKIKIDWVSECGDYITLPSSEMKNGVAHEVPLLPVPKEIVQRRMQMVRELEELHGRWLPKIEYLFVQDGPRRNHVGKPLTQVTNRAWRNAVARAGLPKGTRFHDLRHTFASLHKRAGSDPLMIQKLGGWQSSRSMDRYTHILGPDLKRAAHNLDGVL